MTSSEFQKTKRKVLTKRGVLWLGQTCNLRCKFCYFVNRIDSVDHPEHPFMSLEKAKEICSILVKYFGNNAIDIQGGEPTIYKDIFELVAYCREIGLLPSLITNALTLSNKRICQKFKDAGVRDFLVSVHGLGDVYDEVVGDIPGASKKQLKGIDNCLEIGIPMRFNCVLSKSALPQLTDIAKLAVQKKIRVVNFIAFNPFEDQHRNGVRCADNVPRYGEIVKYLDNAMDILDSAGVECNVRYFPICMVAKKHRKSVYDFQQLPYDIHEWDFASWSWTGMKLQRMKSGNLTPVKSLEYLTYGRSSAVNSALKIIKQPAERILAHYPLLLTKAVQTYQAMSSFSLRTLQPGKHKNVNLETLYRDHGRQRAQKDCSYAYGEKCNDCNVKEICDGFHNDYAQFYGTDEALPITDTLVITDPLYFIREQEKVVEIEDYSWVL